MALSDVRLLSAPHEVHFCGFRSTTTQLQQAGWQLSVSQDHGAYRDNLRLAMHNKNFGGYMVADALSWEPYRPIQMHERLTFIVRRVCADVFIGPYMDFTLFKPIDARPQYSSTERKSIKDFNIFASQLVRTEEIIIEPQSVAECLDLIRKMQAPELAAIRQRNANRDFEQATNQMKFHAQVMSLAA
jgi:hypothetical protein